MPMPLEEDIRRPLGSMAYGQAWHEERAWNSQAQKEYRDVIMGNERSPRCEAQYTREQAEPRVDGSEPSLREMSQDAVEAYVRQLRVRQAELQMENEKLRATVGKFERSQRQCAEFFDPPFEPESVTDTVQESLLVLDRTLRVISANQTFYRVFQVPPEETCGQYFYEMADRQWDIPELRSLLEDILPHNTSFEDFEVEHEFATIGRRTMLLNARRIRRQDQDTEMILLAIQDITIRREQQKKIQEHQRELASLTEELLLAEEQERHRIAMVLHDSIGQSLAFSKRELGVLQKQSPENIRAGLEYVKEQIDLAVRQTRDLTFELSPTTLYTFGLEAAVEELAEQFAAREHLRCHFQATEEDKPLTEQTRTLLYRAARELLLNAGKHAQAKNVIIRIDRVDTSVRMVIEDDGKGFDVSQLERNTRREGFGLFSIRERLTHVGGRFAIESHPGGGTKVTLIAPLNREQTVKSRSEKP